MELNWQTKGIVLTAPLTDEIDVVEKFIREYLNVNGFNMIVLQTRYRYQFKSHPEIRGYDPLSYEDVKRLVTVCKENGIVLVPKMNLIGHQSGLHNTPTDGIIHGHNNVSSDIKDGLLEAYPEFDEQKEQDAIHYARSICLSNEEALKVLFDLIDELMEVFESDKIHIGCDEGFNMGLCEKCSKVPKYQLIANWVNKINEHVKVRGGEIYMWGDRLLSTHETGYNEWEASNTKTEKARTLLSKDIVICDWHYDMKNKYPSVDIFGENGFEIMISPWREKENSISFINYAKTHDKGHIRGLLTTTWCGSGDLAKRILYGEKGKWEHTEQIANTINDLFSAGK
ncbi:MAG: family 20 glycosylhydrolase [Clostridia bacterium]|nr:family 20 glycosylhydrolase [Clostridia bacterium]